MTIRRLWRRRVFLVAPVAIALFLFSSRLPTWSDPPSPPADSHAAAAGAPPPDGDTVPPIPVPTDQPPPELPAPSPIPLGRGLLVGGALDMRYRASDTGRRYSPWVNAAELDLAHPLTEKGQALGNVVLQLIGEDPPDIPGGRDVQIGEAYVLYKLPVQTDTNSTAYLKVGQFQLPFGLLAVYDPHLLLLQPLYAQSLGVRLDWGLAVSGQFYGYLNYDFAVTSGSGPNHADVDPNRVVTFRLGRTFVTRNGVVNVGGSLLSGRLPIVDPDKDHPLAVELPASGRVRADRGFVAKSRIAGDATLTYKNVTARGEAMLGADDDQRVLGYYAEGDYRFSPRASVVLARALWVYPTGDSNSSREALGLTYGAGTHLTFRALYENLRDKPRDLGSRVRQRLTVQVLLRF